MDSYKGILPEKTLLSGEEKLSERFEAKKTMAGERLCIRDYPTYRCG